MLHFDPEKKRRENRHREEGKRAAFATRRHPLRKGEKGRGKQSTCTGEKGKRGGERRRVSLVDKPLKRGEKGEKTRKKGTWRSTLSKERGKRSSADGGRALSQKKTTR